MRYVYTSQIQELRQKVARYEDQSSSEGMIMNLADVLPRC